MRDANQRNWYNLYPRHFRSELPAAHAFTVVMEIKSSLASGSGSLAFEKEALGPFRRSSCRSFGARTSDFSVRGVSLWRAGERSKRTPGSRPPVLKRSSASVSGIHPGHLAHWMGGGRHSSRECCCPNSHSSIPSVHEYVAKGASRSPSWRSDSDLQIASWHPKTSRGSCQRTYDGSPPAQIIRQSSRRLRSRSDAPPESSPSSAAVALFHSGKLVEKENGI